MRLLRLMSVALALAHAAPACAAPDPIAGLRREPMMLAVTLPGGAATTLEALTLRPDRPGRFPLVVMIHGTPRDGDFTKVSPAAFNLPAIAFARRGYAAAAVMRRGFGTSQKPFAEAFPRGSTCETRYYTPIARISAEDVIGATAALARQPWVDPTRVILLGQSTGGVAVTAALAANIPGVRGVLDFAGGRGSNAPDSVCNPNGLVSMFADLGQTARLPALWVFAQNDHFFGPDLARRMHAAYTEAGAPAQLALLPPFGADGHTLLTQGAEPLWWPTVAPFLQSLGMPTEPVIDLAPMPPIDRPPGMRGGACRTAFETYVESRTPAKSYAWSPSDDHCGWVFSARTPEEAQDLAMANCQKSGRACRPYAIGQALAE